MAPSATARPHSEKVAAADKDKDKAGDGYAQRIAQLRAKHGRSLGTS